MTYDYELTLIGETYTEDEIGNQIPVEIETVILCGLKSVSRNEFYNAAVNDLKPERVFVIHPYEYDNQKKVEFEGERYRVIRTYQKDIEEMELIVEKVAGDG
jgi:SPP1 family predicted phage head-tail adaptor